MNLLAYFQERLIVLLAVSLVFFATFVLSQHKKSPIYVTQAANFEVSKLPTLRDPSSFPVLSAQGVYAYDLDSGVVLYEKNSDEILFPASTTKIVTALVALDAYDLDQVLNTGTVVVPGSRMGLAWHEKMTARDLLYGLLVFSANDAAEVLAQNFPGGREEFVKHMNLKARELHAYNTRFLNPSGLDEPGQMTTAKDLARIASQAMSESTFAQIVGTREYVAKNTDGTIVHRLENRNELLGKVKGVLGVKTGWTENARENLVTFVERDGKKVVIAILGSQDRFGESEDLVEWIYGSFEWRDINYSPVFSSP